MDWMKSVVVLFFVGVLLYTIKHFGYATFAMLHETKSCSSSKKHRDRAFAWWRVALLGLMIGTLGIIFVVLGANMVAAVAVIVIGVIFFVVGQTGYVLFNKKARQP
jgi:hypothetical protein